MKLTKFLLVAIAALSSLTAYADPIDMGVEYRLGNHPDGGARPPLYGLRLDGLTTGNQSDVFTFDFENSGAAMSMIWNGDGSLDIGGTAFGGLNNNSGGYVAGQAVLWTVEFTYASLFDCASGGGQCANAGTGTITSSLGSFDLVAVSGNHSYAFQLNNGHRGVPGVSGWGWMNHCRSAGSVGAGGDCNSHLYSSDWLFTAQPVPEPDALALMGLGLLGLALRRRQLNTSG